jgi:hypothetical protein
MQVEHGIATRIMATDFAARTLRAFVHLHCIVIRNVFGRVATWGVFVAQVKLFGVDSQVASEGFVAMDKDVLLVHTWVSFTKRYFLPSQISEIKKAFPHVYQAVECSVL